MFIWRKQKVGALLIYALNGSIVLDVLKITAQSPSSASSSCRQTTYLEELASNCMLPVRRRDSSVSFGEKHKKCADLMCVLIPIILCDLGDKETSGEWQSLSSGIMVVDWISTSDIILAVYTDISSCIHFQMRVDYANCVQIFPVNEKSWIHYWNQLAA